MEPCIFCRIGAREIPAEVVYEDDHVMAFKDINPQAPVHVLIIPKKHIPTLLDLAEDDATLLGKVYLAAQEIARKCGIAGDGFRVVANCGQAAGQTVFHVHFHLLGGRTMGWPPG